MARLAPGIALLAGFCAKSTVQRKQKIYQWFIIIFTFFIYCTYHLSRKPISVVKGVLHENHSDYSNCSGYENCSWAPFDQHNYKQLEGSLDYSFLFAYAIGMFFSGHIAERVNLRYFLFFGMVTSGLFTALFGCAYYWEIHSFPYFLMMMILSGVAQSTGWPSVVACTANWLGKGNRGFIMGLWNSHTSIGNILGTVIPAVFVQYNWGLSFIVPGAIIGGMGMLVMFFLVPHPSDVDLPDPNRRSSVSCNVNVSPEVVVDSPTNKDSDAEEGYANSVTSDNSEEDVLLPTPQIEGPPDRAITLWQALWIPGVIEFAACLFFAKLVSYTFLFWLPNYVMTALKVSASKAANISTAFDFGGIIGATVAGYISDRTGKSALTCLIMFAFAAPLLYVYQLVGGHSLWVSIVMLIVCGAFVNGPYGLITTAVSAELGTHESLRGSSKALATVTAIIDGTGSMGAAFGPLLTGLIAPYGWQYVFYMLIAADGLAFILLLRLSVKEVLSIIEARRRSMFPEY